MTSDIMQGLEDLWNYFEANATGDNFEPLEDKTYLTIITNINKYINKLEMEK